ncbi:protein VERNALIZATION 1-like [Ziziphus jujuba]|uniref:Protein VERNALIZATION 1-like n=1 Tax=Ziziphus jujuba TaxID=326968 RepID=A0A6P4APS8_ZIZJJ|nr:protein VERNALIZATION 1-like [Ziziphus jujuba]
MRRGKVEVKRIGDTQSRQVAFSKRRKGLFKKAHELSVLCDVDLALVVFSTSGKTYEFSTGNSISKILERHGSKSNSQKIACGNDPKEECADPRNGNSNVQSVKRAFDSLNLEQLNSIDIVQLEQLLNLSLRQVQYSKAQLMMKSMAVLHKKEKRVVEENQMVQNENHIGVHMGNKELNIMAVDSFQTYEDDDDEGFHHAPIQMLGLENEDGGVSYYRGGSLSL